MSAIAKRTESGYCVDGAVTRPATTPGRAVSAASRRRLRLHSVAMHHRNPMHVSTDRGEPVGGGQ